MNAAFFGCFNTRMGVTIIVRSSREDGTKSIIEHAIKVKMQWYWCDNFLATESPWGPSLARMFINIEINIISFLIMVEIADFLQEKGTPAKLTS